MIFERFFDSFAAALENEIEPTVAGQKTRRNNTTNLIKVKLSLKGKDKRY